MTAEKLKQRLQKSAEDLPISVSTLDSIPLPSLHTHCIDEIRKFEAMAKELSSICDLIDAREDARQLLQQLPLVADSSLDLVDYHGRKIHFRSARLLGFQCYLSMTWAICDSITTAIAPLICTEFTCTTRNNPPQLLTHFIKSEKNSPYYSASFLKLNYGWPIGVSYVIRNHFVHDGALRNGKDFLQVEAWQINLIYPRKVGIC